MFEDIRFHLTFCNEPGCVAANVVLLMGAFLLGIWMAYEIWRKPWRTRFNTIGMNPYGMSLDDMASAENIAADVPPPDLVPAGGMQKAEAELEPVQEGEIYEDPRLGRIYLRKPTLQDDLKQIRDIGHVLESKLHYYGIYRYEQIANWTPQNESEFSQRLTLTDQIARDRWIPQAAELAEIEARKRARAERKTPDYDLIILSRFAGDEVEVDEELGIIYLSEPEVSDDLQMIVGIGDEAELELNNLGVYRLKQIAVWSPENVAAAASRLKIPVEQIEREGWVQQAHELYLKHYNASPYWRMLPTPSLQDYQRKIAADYPGEPVKADPDFGIVYTRVPDFPDDLRRIRGMTDHAAVLLRGSGVFRFQQVADWSEANVDAFARQLDLHPERIYRDGWISHAAQLAQEANRRSPQLV